MAKPSHCAVLCAVAALIFLVSPVAAQSFGNAIVVADGEILIGEPENLYRPGVVYVYARENSAWIEQAQIMAPDAEMSDHFGESLAADGERLIVGATGVEGRTGSAYVFEREGSNWVHAATLKPADLDPEDRFGRQVALAGNLALVGAPADDDKPGAAYVFSRGANGSWTQQARLAGSGASAGSAFGVALATDGNVVLVGAPGQSENTGAVYAFELEGGSWTEQQLIEGRLTEKGDRYGSTLELQGDDLVVGVPRSHNRVGSAIVYRKVSSTGKWEGMSLLQPFAATSPPSFASAVSLSGDDVWVGAPFGNMFSGAVYRFERSDDGGWVSSAVMGSDRTERRDLYGGALDVKGDVGAVGITGDDYGAGSVAVYERDASGLWSETAWLQGAPSGLDPITGDQVECDQGSAALFECDNVDLLSFLPISSLGGARGVQLNDIWGWTDPTTGKEYALVGRVDGTSFVDVTDPSAPFFLGDLPKTKGSPGSAWRDIKVYKDHAFIVSDGAGEHGMQVFDLKQLRNVSNPPALFEEVAHYDRIHSTHNIVINTETGFAYAVGNGAGGETCGGGLHMIDIQDPANPTFAGCYSAEGTGRAGTGYTHDAQCLIYHGPDSDHAGREICFGSNETALNVADVTDKQNPVNIATASYPNVSYTHQGWISDDHRYFYVNDELDELSGNASETRTLVWDVTDLDDPQLVKEYMWGNKSTDHNLYIRGNLMYQSNYASGLRIHDISDPENPAEVGFFDTVPVGDNGPGFSGSWSNYPFFASGTIAVSSIGEGLFLLRKKKELGL